ncbi:MULTISPECIES: hypothetical protein [Paenibacillus]|uniref:Uncharacterized protein n=1 Tax=Paenibacillus naphthalenovorans TaxID=162209 RepID=A0A0U2VNY9_9BACL|nr:MULTISPECIES: hypothetical protein [Paenibacillus]ALS24979.1 hypothetical protein IJ22_47170 [Paenibacillus naphthalenovorans]NTZ19149.1 hypothetical protein [Paenibacillus sp. JMULE4]GCL74091.1 hypothetical protein PN4B1_40330 [Paenibacillus naphthalenovorans]
MRKIAALYGGCSQHHRTLNEPKYRRFFDELIYLPDLETASLDKYDVLLCPSQLHQGMVEKSAAKIRAVAERGGTVVAFGPQSRPWIPGHHWEFRPTNFWWWLDKDARSGLVQANPGHSLFQAITLEDATWHYHGVFWPPEGSDVLIALEDNGAILYIDKVSTAGTWIVTTLDPDYHFGSYFMPATERFLDGFLPWLAEGTW